MALPLFLTHVIDTPPSEIPDDDLLRIEAVLDQRLGLVRREISQRNLVQGLYLRFDKAVYGAYRDHRDLKDLITAPFDKIELIKLVREVSGRGLREAKEICEAPGWQFLCDVDSLRTINHEALLPTSRLDATRVQKHVGVSPSDKE